MYVGARDPDVEALVEHGEDFFALSGRPAALRWVHILARETTVLLPLKPASETTLLPSAAEIATRLTAVVDDLETTLERV